MEGWLIPEMDMIVNLTETNELSWVRLPDCWTQSFLENENHLLTSALSAALLDESKAKFSCALASPVDVANCVYFWKTN